MHIGKAQLKTQSLFIRNDVLPENCTLLSSARARLELDQNRLFAKIDLAHFLFPLERHG